MIHSTLTSTNKADSRIRYVYNLKPWLDGEAHVTDDNYAMIGYHRSHGIWWGIWLATIDGGSVE